MPGWTEPNLTKSDSGWRSYRHRVARTLYSTRSNAARKRPAVFLAESRKVRGNREV
jgi:hypothetical protein